MEMKLKKTIQMFSINYKRQTKNQPNLRIFRNESVGITGKI